MIELRTEVDVAGISGKNVAEFMLQCTDETYQNWWPGTHLAFHTTERFPGDVGNRVVFDEFVGNRKLKFAGVVTEYIPGKTVAWQMRKIVRLPAWLVLEFEDNDTGVVITHTIKAGFEGIGRLLDPFLRFFLNEGFENDLAEHAHIEFTELAKILA